MKTIRTFFAIDPSDEMRKQISDLIAMLKKPHDSIRWIPVKNLHITLHFLGVVKMEDLTNLIHLVKTEISSIRPFQLKMGNKPELFPNHHHPRVIALNIEPSDSLLQLVDHIGKGIVAAGYPIERRPFRGHLTLARLDQVKNDFALPEIDFHQFPECQVKDILFYQSEVAHTGSVYTVLERFSLN